MVWLLSQGNLERKAVNKRVLEERNSIKIGGMKSTAFELMGRPMKMEGVL